MPGRRDLAFAIAGFAVCLIAVLMLVQPSVAEESGEVLAEDSTIIAPDWITTNNSTRTVTYWNTTLEGGPILGSGSVTCRNVTDEHGTFYANTCPN